ncbi:copper transport protein [Nocardioides alpinus]|uniref:Copper resistance protein CopC n=1 Tax=Nocardioides alpinus TaxID=748909 RepID=A0A1I0Y6L2_9ACTN|nr:copper resistance protein CopC [Nocardioides alpinus]PKH39021.1 copper resistance protein CopC [Nocardioides alpinus]SFB08949.1 copper transport protein [Nocardioides alpinus]
MTRHPARRRSAAWLLLACLSVLLLLGSASPASAHATLVSTDPAEGAVLEAAPEQVRFTFNESVIGVPAGIQVFDATGDAVASSASVRDSQLVVDLDEEVGEGTLVVVWRLVSADGHPIGGSLSFSVGAASDVVDVPTSTADADTEAPLVLTVVRWLGYLGLLVAAGVAAFSVLFLPARPDSPAARARLRTAARLAAVVAALAWWAAVPLVALYQLGLPVSALGDGPTWSALAAAEYVVPAALVLGLALAVVATRPPLVLLGCVLAVAAPSLTGHTRAVTPEALVIAVDVLHLAAGALWLGGLVALSLVLGDLAARDDAGAVVLSRFSTWAAGILGVLVVAGSVLAWRIAGSWEALLDTGYGGFLLVKVLLVLVAIALAAWNRWSLLPRLRTAGRRRERRDAASLVVRTTVAEAGVLVAVLLVTGFLVDRSPEVDAPVSAAAPAAETAAETVRLDDITAEVTLDPLGVGPSTVTITMTDDAGEPAEGFAAPRLSLSTTDVDLGEVVLTNLGPGIYAGDVVLPTTGEWEAQVSLRTTEFDNPVKTVELVVP